MENVKEILIWKLSRGCSNSNKTNIRTVCIKQLQKFVSMQEQPINQPPPHIASADDDDDGNEKL